MDAGRPRDARTASPMDAAREDAGCVPQPIVDPNLLAECPFCRGGRCVPGDSLPPGSREQLADCSESHECLPDVYLETGGRFVPESCRSTFGVEGRCLSTCLPSVMRILDTVPQDTCPDDHRCVPCYDPRTGEATSACSQSCDPGPVEPPRVVAPCCEGLGFCYPRDDVPEDARDVLVACEEESELCVPTVLAGTSGWTPPPCTSASYGAGVCLHQCFAAVEPYRAFLAREGCDEQFLCVPCVDPTTGAETGACESTEPDGGTPDAG